MFDYYYLVVIVWRLLFGSFCSVVIIYRYYLVLFFRGRCLLLFFSSYCLLVFGNLGCYYSRRCFRCVGLGGVGCSVFVFDLGVFRSCRVLFEGRGIVFLGFWVVRF